MAVLWGWGLVAGLLLGLGLSVASTVVLLRVLEERNALDKVDGRIAIGWLIVQDLAMVLVLVLLPALAGSSEGPPQFAPRVLGDGIGVTLALTVAKVAAFVALVLVVGTRLVPWLLEQVARTDYASCLLCRCWRQHAKHSALIRTPSTIVAQDVVPARRAQSPQC